MRTISVRLLEHVLEAVEAQARDRHVTRSQLMRDCLVMTLMENQSADEVSRFDLACDLAGSVKGLAEDIAHDSRYMDGFGDRTVK